MHILLLELKRVIKSRMTLVLLTVAVALSAFISFEVISEAKYIYVNGNGRQASITGMAAIRANKKRMKPLEGQITEEKLKEALVTFQNFYRLSQKHPDDPTFSARFDEKIAPLDYFLDMINQVYPGGEDEYESLNKIDPNCLTGFYHQRTETLKTKLGIKYPGNQNILSKVSKLNREVTTPFILVEGYMADNTVNLCILIFLLVLICAMTVSPIFSAEYQNGSDDVLRCTKNGRVKLAIVKSVSALLIVLAMFAVCTLIFVLSVNSAYGWDSLWTSVQVISALSFVPLTIGQEQCLTVLAGLLTLLAAACFVLFVSAKCQHPTTALIIAVAFCILPAILHSVWHGNISNFVTCVLPTGGAGISNSFFSQLNLTTFVHIGSFDIWSPYLIIAATIIEIPLFFLLSLHAYCRHQAT